MVVGLWLLLLHLLLWSHNPLSALFVEPPSVIEPYPALKLATTDRLGIRYEGVAVNAGEAASLPSFALSLNAIFRPNLTQNQFQTLLKAYCGWSETKSRVVYKKGHRYTLLDFLPPLMQATSGLHFESSRRKQFGLPSLVGGPDDRVRRYSEQEILLTSNCWGFAWEVLYQADNADTSAMTISTADPTSAWRAFSGPNFDLIQTSLTQPKLLSDAELRNRDVQAGDVLLIWHRNPSTTTGTDLYLDHVATYLDNDVYYEKSGSGDKVPFRVSEWQMITANFPTYIFFWEWRRLVRNNPLSPSLYGSIPRLRPASKQFGIDSQIEASNQYVPSTKRKIQDRFSVLSDLRAGIQQRLSLQASVDAGGAVESELYTGILVLEDFLFDKTTGRASLPESAFTQEFYNEKFYNFQSFFKKQRQGFWGEKN